RALVRGTPDRIRARSSDLARQGARRQVGARDGRGDAPRRRALFGRRAARGRSHGGRGPLSGIGGAPRLPKAGVEPATRYPKRPATMISMVRFVPSAARLALGALILAGVVGCSGKMGSDQVPASETYDPGNPQPSYSPPPPSEAQRTRQMDAKQAEMNKKIED